MINREKIIYDMLEKYKNDKEYVYRILECSSKTNSPLIFNNKEYTKSEAIALYAYFCAYTLDDYNVVRKEVNKIRNRQYRLRTKIQDIFDSGLDCYFITLTFDPYYYSLNIDTRRRYIKDYLKNNFISYIANIDFGKTTNREHFHAIVTYYDDITIAKDKYIFGFSDFEFIHDENKYKLSEYINKLCKHSTKLRYKVIYSRTKKEL